MSRTKRKNSEDLQPKRGDYIMFGRVLKNDTPEWKKYRDKKSHRKPGKKAKQCLHKGRKTALKKDLKVKDIEEFDNIPKPIEKKTDVWNYN